MKRRGGASLRPGLSATEKRWGPDRWKGCALGGLGEGRELGLSSALEVMEKESGGLQEIKSDDKSMGLVGE